MPAVPHQVSQTVDQLDRSYQDNFAAVIGSIDNYGIMTYLTIFVIFLFIAKLVNISLSIVFFMMVALLVCYLIYSGRQIQNLKQADADAIKLGLVVPRPKRINKYPDLINFLYSIRTLYYVNPNAFHALVSDIDNFIQLYDEIMDDDMLYCSQNFEVAANFARNAQNDLHSIIFNLDTSEQITRQFHRSLETLALILRQYLVRLAKKCNRSFNPTTVYNGSKHIETSGPKPFNYYDYKEQLRGQFDIY